jgi:O-antigen/teichoic acid export membrane protein
VAAAAPARDFSRNLTGSIGRNTAFGILHTVVQVLTRLITVPTAISHLGLVGYGIWSIIMTTAMYVRFGGLGLKSAFQTYVAAATGNHDYDTASKLLSTGCAAAVILSVPALLPLAISPEAVPRVLGVPASFVYSSAWAIAILAVTMVISNAGAVYEAILLGGHRIDITRTLGTVTSVLEAVAIIVLLKLGYKLVAMATVMAASQIVYFAGCFIASRRVLPQVAVSLRHLSRKVIPELFRFAGSYQLLGILLITYNAIAPVIVLRSYGGDKAGIYAIGTRLISPVSMAQYAFLVPILSGSSMIHAAGSTERMQRLVAKAFKFMFVTTFTPLALISLFAADFILAWTGQAQRDFSAAVAWQAAAAFLQAVSGLSAVVYRSSGRALMDNIRGGLRIGVLLALLVFAKSMGFVGVMAGLAFAELLGMLVMLSALRRTVAGFSIGSVAADAARVVAATAGVAVVASLAVRLPLPWAATAREGAVIRSGLVAFAIAFSAVPAFLFARVVSIPELRGMIAAVRGKLAGQSAVAQ